MDEGCPAAAAWPGGRERGGKGRCEPAARAGGKGAAAQARGLESEGMGGNRRGKGRERGRDKQESG